MNNDTALTPCTFAAIRACAIVLLAGNVIQAGHVSAGNGKVIDWRTVRSGELLQDGADSFDTAQLFVGLVGPDAAVLATADFEIEPASPILIQPRIHAYMQASNGGRRRTFDTGDFTVVVEPHENDAAQANFTARLAALCARVYPSTI